MKYNSDIRMKYMITDMRNDMTKGYDMKEDASRVILNDIENEKMLEPHTLLCAHALGIPLIPHDSTGAYTNRQGNDHYVYHNSPTKEEFLGWKDPNLSLIFAGPLRKEICMEKRNGHKTFFIFSFVQSPVSFEWKRNKCKKGAAIPQKSHAVADFEHTNR